MAYCSPLEERLTVRVRTDYAADFDGFTKIRQFDEEGTRLGLREDLGVDEWFDLGLDVGWRFDRMHAVSGGFTMNGFRGVNTLDRDVVHEGERYAPGTNLKFDRTSWWRAEGWYLFTPWREEYASISLLGGIVVDFLDIHVVPMDRSDRQARDAHENLGTSWVPLPAIGVRVDLNPVAGLRMHWRCEAPTCRTWHTTGGNKRHGQTNLDLAFETGYRIAQVGFGAGLRHKLFHIEQNNIEDGNEFKLQGTHAGLYIRIHL